MQLKVAQTDDKHLHSFQLKISYTYGRTMYRSHNSGPWHSAFIRLMKMRQQKLTSFVDERCSDELLHEGESNIK
jgi:hypothetical protein